MTLSSHGGEVVSVDEAALEPDNAAAVEAHTACIACGAARSGPFCSRCGQREIRGRYTLRGFLGNTLRRTVGEEGALNTVHRLSTHPGRVVHEYLAGCTVRYVHPAAYLLLTAALFTLVGRLLLGSTGAAQSDRAFVLLVIPILAAVSRVLFWRGRYNYAEHLIAVTYITAHSVLILAVLTIGTIIVPQQHLGVYAMAGVGAAVAFFAWAYSRIFEKHPWLAAVAAIVTLVIGTIGWLVALTSVVKMMSA